MASYVLKIETLTYTVTYTTNEYDLIMPDVSLSRGIIECNCIVFTWAELYSYIEKSQFGNFSDLLY